MTRHLVCRWDELPDKALKGVRVAGRDLVLVRNGEHVFVLRDICPHQGAKLSCGLLTGARIAPTPGDYRMEKAGQIIRCPWHNWEFDAADGRCLHDPQRTRVAAYAVQIEDGQVFVEM